VSEEPAIGSFPGLDGLPGLQSVRDQLADVLAVIRAEQARAAAGAVVTRRVWKNLVFTGGPGSGKSRAAAAVARAYRGLGVLSSGHLIEIASAGLPAQDLQRTGTVVREAASRGRGGVLMITGAHGYAGLRHRDHLVLRSLHEMLTEFRDDLAVILAGQAGPLHKVLQSSPSLASQFPAVIDFPGYSTGQLAAIFTVLAREAGFTLTPDAARLVARVLSRPAQAPGCGNARLAVRLLDQAIARQARRITGATHPPTDDELCTLRGDDIAGLPATEPANPADDRPPGQYL